MIKSSWFYVKFKYAEKVSGTSALLPYPDPSGTENFPGALGERGARRPMGEHRSVRGGDGRERRSDMIPVALFYFSQQSSGGDVFAFRACAA